MFKTFGKYKYSDFFATTVRLNLLLSVAHQT